jgi:hypothetical protein
MNEPVIKTEIDEHYQKYLNHESEELTERLGANGPLELTYISWEEMIREFHSLGINIIFDNDLSDY